MANLDLPPFVAIEREAVTDEIRRVFSEVDREGGITWSEAEVLDLYGTPEDRASARASDRDGGWQDLVEDPEWDHEPRVGGWSFLDAIGFRYYLPAAMIRALTEGEGWGLLYHLTLPEGDLREHNMEKWSRFDHSQRLCAKRFLQVLTVIHGWYDVWSGDGDGASRALASYWERVSNEPESSSLTSKG